MVCTHSPRPPRRPGQAYRLNNRWHTARGFTRGTSPISPYSQDTALSRRRPRVRIPHTLPRYGKCKAPALAIPMMLIVTAVGADQRQLDLPLALTIFAGHKW